ncbi:MAG: capsule assembly Wzi family protein [Agarilytica sp.]
MAIVKRPISVALLETAIEKIESNEPALSRELTRYLERYNNTSGFHHAELKLSNEREGSTPLANNRGYTSSSDYTASLSGHLYQNNWLALNLGVISGQREPNSNEESPQETFPDGTYLSFGWDAMQLDFGYRPHWLGPFQESDMLFSTNTTSLPGITISNTTPANFLGFQYEMFFLEISESNVIRSQDRSERLQGKPKLFGLHLGFHPLPGFAIGFNRLAQYGGADREDGLGDIAQALYNPRRNDNSGGEEENDFGNQLSSITTRFTFSGERPISIYMEYAGEDTSFSSKYAFSNSALMFGFHAPQIADSLDFTYEFAEWQNAWYTNGNYGDGLTHYNSVLGHWGGDRRAINDSVGATAETIKLVWDLNRNSLLTTKIQSLKNKSYSTHQYETNQELALSYSTQIQKCWLNIELVKGEDVFGESYQLLSGGIQW